MQMLQCGSCCIFHHQVCQVFAHIISIWHTQFGAYAQLWFSIHFEIGMKILSLQVSFLMIILAKKDTICPQAQDSISTRLIFNFKGEKILKGSLDSIPTPSISVIIQIMGGSLLEEKRQNIVGHCQQTFQKFVDITQQYFALLLQANLPANDFNFH